MYIITATTLEQLYNAENMPRYMLLQALVIYAPYYVITFTTDSTFISVVCLCYMAMNIFNMVIYNRHHEHKNKIGSMLSVSYDISSK